MKRRAIITGIVLATAAVGVGQEAGQGRAQESPEMAAVQANARAFEAAYAKGDVKTLADFFSEDAEYTAEDGRTFNGRAAIEQSLRAAFLSNKGATLAINVDSVRRFAPEVVLEKGSTLVTAKDGETVGSLYSAIHIKEGDKWKINQLVETPLPVVSPNERLSELGWLVGRWEEVDKSGDLRIQSQVDWARGGNFITRNVTVKRGGEVTLEGWQIIGWDPVEERLRSWTFDGEGGFAEGFWTREGERWLLRETGSTADGSHTTSEQTITRVNADKFTWQSDNRTLDGDPQPSIGGIEVNRVKGN